MSSEHLPVIKNGELSKKKLTGKLVLRGACPACGAALSLSEEEVLRRKDSCPDCRAPFVVGLPEFKKVQTLHAAVEEAKQQAIRASEEVAEEKRRVAKEQAEVFQRQRVAAAEKMRVAKEQEAVSAREKANVERESSVDDLPRMAMEEGIQGSDEKFPNIPRALAMWESIVGVSMVAGGLALFGLVIYGLDVLKESTGAGLSLLFSVVIGGVILAIWYVFAMAAIELYKVFVTIEDSTRKNNALVAVQIELLRKLVEKEN